MELIYGYLTERNQIVKINNQFSSLMVIYLVHQKRLFDFV